MARNSARLFLAEEVVAPAAAETTPKPEEKAVKIMLTTCGAFGRAGPKQRSCDLTYGGGVVRVTRGYQVWGVPKTGFYRISARGARGGHHGKGLGGNGAEVVRFVSLSKGERLVAVVGQHGWDNPTDSEWGGGGGGGTFVARITAATGDFVPSLGFNVMLLVAAGGGAGRADRYNSGQANGGMDNPGDPISIGMGGLSGAGGGYKFDGRGGGVGAKSFVNGAIGGRDEDHFGGFGGGGGPYDGAGGGGGFDGGDCTIGGANLDCFGGSSFGGRATADANDNDGSVLIEEEPEANRCRPGTWRITLNTREKMKCNMKDVEGKEICHEGSVEIAAKADSCTLFQVMRYKTCSPQDVKCARFKCPANGVLRLETMYGDHVDSGSEDTMLTCANTKFTVASAQFCLEDALDCADGRATTARSYATTTPKPMPGSQVYRAKALSAVPPEVSQSNRQEQNYLPAVKKLSSEGASGPPMEEYIRMLGGPGIAAKFRYCALVEGSELLAGQKQGEDIDKHDTVIRINVLPGAAESADYGQKTDIYFASARDSADRYTKEGYDVQYMGKERARCPWCDGKKCNDMCWQSPHSLCRYVNDTEHCPFGSLVLAAAQVRGRKWEPTWKLAKADFAVGMQSGVVSSAVQVLEDLQLNGQRATAAFQAYFTFAPICETTSLYGFDLAGAPELVERKLLRALFPEYAGVLETTVVAELVYEGAGQGGTNSGIELVADKTSCSFVFHPGEEGGQARSCGFWNQNMGWTPASGLAYQFRITLRSNGTHTFDIIDSQNSTRRWSKRFNKPGFFAMQPAVKAWSNDVGGKLLEVGVESAIELEGHHTYKLLSVGQVSYWAVDGCRTSGPPVEPQLLAPDSDAAVRCCSQYGTVCESIQLGCLQERTFAQAELACASRGMRLCTRAELEGDLCCGTGCGFDNQLVWTSTQVTCTSLCDARRPASVQHMKRPCSDPRVSDMRACQRLAQLVGRLESRRFRRVA